MFPEAHTWHAIDHESAAKHLRTSLTEGLNGEEVRKRQLQFGPNALEKKQQFRVVRTIIKQMISPLALVLLIAALATLFLREFLDTVVIVVALLVNVVVGTVQEGRASNVFEKLASSQEEETTVYRNGIKHVVKTVDLVPGDIVVLDAGKAIPADIRIVEAHNLSINEAALTGEWVAVHKEAVTCREKVPLTERTNMAWKGTVVTEGFGRGVVVATGAHTQIGEIARDTEEVTEQATPLQKSVRRLARLLMFVILVAVLAISILGIARGEAFAEMLLIAIAIAVAAIPSGLPAAVTVVLAIGMEAVLRKGGLVKNLLAAETLGSTTVILTDKTGTLTEGKMSVDAFYTTRSMGQHDASLAHDDNRELLRMAILASDAFVEEGKDGMQVRGRPIEQAIVAAGLAEGITQKDLFAHGNARKDFLQFASKRRYSASFNEHPSGARIYFSGAPEQLLDRASHCFVAGGKRELDAETRKHFADVQRAESAQGNRFVGVAYLEHSGAAIGDDIRDGKGVRKLVFVGLVAFSDQIRPDVATEIAKARGAGVRVVMVTGDYPATAQSIAERVGICTADVCVQTGRDIEDMEDADLLEALRSHTVFARVLPQQKLRIARVLKSAGEVVSMTGDGVNDAPALVSADIGVAVGSGTDVAKEAADMILLKNTFSTITAAIREGRRVVDNLRKIVAYLLSTSFSEIIVIGGALAAGAPLPLLPSQILWANLVEEGLMSFPFAFEPADKDVMNQPPRRPQREKSPHLVLAQETRRIIFIVTAVTGFILLALYFFLRSLGLPIEEIRTIMFVALSLDSIFFALSFKNLRQPIWRIPLANNKFLFVGLGVSILLLIAAITVPPLQILLSLTPLSMFDVLLLGGLGIVNLLTIELAKRFVRN